MTHDEIIKLARESGLFVPHEGIPENVAFMRFAHLVVSAEREECAKVCEEDGLLWGQRYAAAIRAMETGAPAR